MNKKLSQEDQKFLNKILDQLQQIAITSTEVSMQALGKYASSLSPANVAHLGRMFNVYGYAGVFFAIKDYCEQKNLDPLKKYALSTFGYLAIVGTGCISVPPLVAAIGIGALVEGSWYLGEWIAENQDDILEKLKQLLADKGVEINDDGSIQCELPTYINICPLPKEPICKIKDLFGTAEEVRSPLVVDMDGDGVETVTAEGGVYFDHDANGFKENSGWVGQDDGILVRDINGNGIIDNGTELFGNNSVLSSGEKAVNGFEALKDLDDNNDGIFDRNDKAWNEVKIWQDKNFNGNYSIVKSANPVFA